MIVVLSVAAILLTLAFLRIGPAADRSAVRAAAMDAAAVIEGARNAAIYRRSAVAVAIDTAHGTLVTRSDSTVLLRRDLRSLYGVHLVAARDSLAFDVRGLGVGLANLSVVARRGGAAETVFVSRLGRVRY
jgi:type II secretory pathway pseudopilin PulG